MTKQNSKFKFQIFIGLLFIIAFLVWIGVFGKFQADTANDLKIYFLNVGQGDSEYIKMPSGEDILIDGGPDNSVLSELGKVMASGDRKIDLVILTHPHADHLTGLIDVINRFEIGQVWETGVEYSSSSYDAWKNLLNKKGISDQFASANLAKQFNDVKISVLYPLLILKNPSDSDADQNIDNLNNSSIILELNFNQFSALFLGDAEINAQNQILNSMKHYNVVKIAHHGSGNGLNSNLMKIAQPNIAVIEVGAKNTYGHPAPITISFLKNLATQIYRTDQDGTVGVYTNGQTWSIKTNL